ncbi:MAG: hypothetical protein M1835_006085 [Candelina submexicana]|nr:MAG: hypothetical protein M1835_006085 [Candelina submexicana]
MDPWQSWAIVLLSGGAAWWYYNSQAKRKTKTTRTPTFSAQGQSKSQKRRDEGKARRRKDGGLENGEPSSSGRPIQSLAASPRASVGGNESTKKRKGGKQTSEKAAVSSAVDAPAAVKVYDEDNEVEEEGMDNREFAKQLSGLKAGTSLAPPTRTGLSKRAAKQARPNGLPQESLRPSSVPESNGVLNSQSVSTTSSTTGADADDDLSPILSPALEATSTGRTSTSGDVSDMLEAPAAGPSVLRLTNSRDSQQVKKPQQQKSPQVQETKKQRQNRQKAEEKKIAREQQEKERRVLLEKQLKTAREAEGRPARNGTAAPKPPATNAWAAQSKQTDEQAIHTSHIDSESDAPLLDTFDQGENGGRDNANGSRLAGTRSQAWERDLPSEEEQLKMIDELDDAGWNTVPKGRKAKKKPLGITGDTTGNESSDGGLSKANEKVNGTSKAPAAQAEKSELEVGSVVGSLGGISTPVKGNPHDSDWAVV